MHCGVSVVVLREQRGQRSGARLRNTWATYPQARDSRPKRLGNPAYAHGSRGPRGKSPASAGGVWGGACGPELVGGVTAHQGWDG